MGDFNIDINTAGIEVDKLDEFCNLFELTNLIKTETCCTENYKSTIDLFQTNRPLSFQKTRATETGNKVGLSPFKENCVVCFNESPLKVMRDAFYFILKAIFVFKIFKFLSCRENGVIRNRRLISKFMKSQPG